MHRFIILLAAVIIAFGIGGCGGGGTSADPLGTDGMMFGHKNDSAGTDWSTAMTVTTRGTIILTAKVKNASGAAVVGREVSFGLFSNTSGAMLSSTTARTDAAGEAVTLYTAGIVAGFDVVRASISNGATLDTNITVGSGGIGGSIITISGSPISLSAGQSSILTATVTDGSGNPIAGQAVTFALLYNNSSATLSTLSGGITDISGKAVAVYTAGAAASTLTVVDTVQASITGSVRALVMTRTAGGGGGAGSVIMTVTATPSALPAEALSVILAQVSNADGTAAVGLPVTFSIATNNSGAPALTVVNGTTDASGTATAMYTAGKNLPGLSRLDAVSASVTGSANAVVITRLPATGTGNRISLTFNPATTSTAPLATTTSNCIVTATVVGDDGSTPIANEPVTFSIVTGLGTMTPPLIVNTNNSGVANAVFTAPGGATGFEAVVRAQILGTTNGGDSVGIIYW